MNTISSPEALEQFRIANDLRFNWHEPIVKGITARVEGRLFDNAFGAYLPDAYAPELTVVLCRDGVDVATVNLATLMAWASRSGRPDSPVAPEPQYRQILTTITGEASHARAHRHLIYQDGHHEAPADYEVRGLAATAAEAQDQAREAMMDCSPRDAGLVAVGFRDGGAQVVGWVFSGYEQVYEPGSTRIERYDLLTVTGEEPGFEPEDAGRLALRYNDRFDRFVIDDWQACLIVGKRTGLAGTIFINQDPAEVQKIGRFCYQSRR